MQQFPNYILKWILILIIFAFPKIATSQDKFIDSLRQLIKQKEQANSLDSSLYSHYYELAKKYYRINQDSSLRYFQEAVKVAHKLNNKNNIGKSAYNSSVIAKRQGKIDVAMENVLLCIDADPEAKLKARCLKQCGDLKMNTNDFVKSKEYFDKAMKIGILTKDTMIISMIHNSYALYFEFNHDFERSIEEHLKSAQISLNQSDSIGYAISLNNIAILHNSMKEYDIALEYTLESEKFIDPDNLYNMYQVEENKATIYAATNQKRKALKYYDRAYEGAKAIKAESLQLSSLYNLAVTHLALDETIKAQDYLSLGLNIESIQSPMKAKYKLALSEIALGEGRCQDAYKLLSEIKKDFTKEPEYSYVSSYYKNLSRANACLGDQKQFDVNLKKAFSTLDSSYKETKSREAKILLHKYQAKIKSDSITLLSLESEKQNFVIKNQRNGLIITLLSLFLSALLIILLRKLNKEAKVKNEALIFKTAELSSINNRLQEKLLHPRVSSHTNRLELKSLDKKYLVDYNEIIYILAEDNGSRIFLTNKSIWSDYKFKDVLKLLPKSKFVKIYRSTIINVDKLEWVNHATLKMVNGEELKIGRTYKTSIKELLSNGY